MTLVDDSAPQTKQPNALQQAVQAISNLILPTHRELITLLRTPTPVKITKVFTVDANGNIGSGYPDTLYRCPMSSEAWLHRITITSPEHNPSAPLTQGEIICTGTTAGEIIFFFPNEFALASPGGAGLVAPAQLVEGRLSAPHLNSGESAVIIGDGLPAGNHIRIDMQIELVSGVSEFTPRTMSPSDLTRSDGTAGIA